MFHSGWELLREHEREVIEVALGPRNDAFDPYPSVFLNLILSMLAALQAPVIMMTQNRQSVLDRLARELRERP